MAWVTIITKRNQHPRFLFSKIPGNSCRPETRWSSERCDAPSGGPHGRPGGDNEFRAVESQETFTLEVARLHLEGRIGA